MTIKEEVQVYWVIVSEKFSGLPIQEIYCGTDYDLAQAERDNAVLTVMIEGNQHRYEVGIFDEFVEEEEEYA